MDEPKPYENAIVNVRDLQGGYIFGGVFRNVDSLVKALLEHVSSENASIAERVARRLWKEHSRFGISDQAVEVTISIYFVNSRRYW